MLYKEKIVTKKKGKQMKNPFTKEEKALLATVLPKLADAIVPNGNPSRRQYLMGQMAAAYVQEYQAPIGKKEIGAALMLSHGDNNPDSVAAIAQIYANARPALREAMGRVVSRRKVGFRRLNQAIFSKSKEKTR